MKICFYCDSIFSFGGVQRVLAVIAKSLAKEHLVTILTLDEPHLNDTTMYDLDESRINYIHLKYAKTPLYEKIPCKAFSILYKTVLPQNKIFSELYGYSSFSHTKRNILIKTLNQGNYDLIVGVHVFLSLNLASIRHKLNSKVIGWMHNSYDAFFSISTSYIGKQKNQFRYLMPKLDDIIVLSKDDKEKYQKELNLVTKVIYNPLTIENKGKHSPENKKFLAVGRFSTLHKGFDILIEAFALFAQHNFEWTLDIVGDGPEKQLLISLIKKHQLEKRVTIHPFTKNIDQHYKSASVYILSSRWEGFGLVLVEAMSYGLPLIVSKLPITKELLENKEVGVFFENENITELAFQMDTIAKNENLQIMSQNALNYSKEFNIEHITKKWKELFDYITK